MACADKGNDVVFNLFAAEAVTFFLAQQQGKEIFRHVGCVFVHAGLSCLHRIGDDAAEKCQRLAAAHACQPGQPGWSLKQVERVNTSVVAGKTKRRGRRLVRTPTRKKAVVFLKPGSTIDLFEGV